MPRNGTFSLLLGAYVLVLILFVFFPILVILPISFTNDRFMQFPPDNYGVRWYRAYLTEPNWMEATFRSLRIAAISSIFSATAGTMLAVWIQRTKGKMSILMNAVALAPAIVPHVLLALGSFIVLAYLRITDSEAALISIHAALAIPFVILVVGGALKQLDPSLERAARVLGASPVQGFCHGTLPSLIPGIVSATLFAFFVSFDEFIVALFVMGKNITLPVRIWTDLQFELSPVIASVSILFVALTTVGMSIAEILRRKL